MEKNNGACRERMLADTGRKIGSIEKYYGAFQIEDGERDLLEKILQRVVEDTGLQSEFDDLIDVKSLLDWNASLVADSEVEIVDKDESDEKSDSPHATALRDGRIMAMKVSEAEDPLDVIAELAELGLPRYVRWMFHQRLHQVQYQSEFPNDYTKAIDVSVVAAIVADIVGTAVGKYAEVDQKLLIAVNLVVVMTILPLLFKRFFGNRWREINRAVVFEVQATMFERFKYAESDQSIVDAVKHYVKATVPNTVRGFKVEEDLQKGSEDDISILSNYVDDAVASVTEQILKLRALGVTHKEIAALAAQVESSSIRKGAAALQCEIVRRQTAMKVDDILLDKKVESLAKAQSELLERVAEITREEIDSAYKQCSVGRPKVKKKSNGGANGVVKSNDSQADADDPKLTDDEALDVLLDRKQIHYTAQSFFGKKLFGDLLEMVEDDEIFELDAMFLQGDITVAEMEEYLMVLPEYHKLRGRMMQWADQLVAHITRNLETTLSESVNRRGRLKTNRGIVRMIISTLEMVSSFSVPGYNTKRNNLVRVLRHYVGTTLVVNVWQRVVNEPELQQYKKLMYKVVESLNEVFVKRMSYRLPGVAAFRNVNALTKAYFFNEHLFEEYMQELKEQNGERTEEDLELAIAEDFEVVNSLSNFRRIEGVKKMYGDVKVEVYEDDLEVANRSAHVAYVKVSFPGADPGSKLEIVRDEKDGVKGMVANLGDNSFNFIIDRHSGEFMIGNALMTLGRVVEIQGGEGFMNRIDFLRMKASIFGLLRSYLEGKEDDIERIFFRRSKESLKDCGDVRTVDESVAVEVESMPVAKWVYKPYQKVVCSEDASVKRVEKEELVIQDIHLDGVYSEELAIAAIVRITGISPLKSARGKSRGKGSHVVVQGQNGARFLLPSHAGKDLSAPILKKCLQSLAIPYSRFKREY